MNWYKFLKFADREKRNQYLQSLGMSQEIIDYINSKDDQTAQLLINQIRQNPSLTINDLEQIGPVQEKQNIALPQEINFTRRFGENTDFTKWILTQFRKLRKGQQFDYDTLPIFERSPEGQPFVQFANKLDEIKDWYSSTQPDIASYSAEQAIQLSDEWHKMIAEKGEGYFYNPTDQLITYGPNWKNEKWQGWTIQKVISENDL